MTGDGSKGSPRHQAAGCGVIVLGSAVVAAVMALATPAGQMLALAAYMLVGTYAYQVWDPPVFWRVKQTLTVETPQGEVVGSVVRAKNRHYEPFLKIAPTSERGEALVLEVLPGRYLFAVIEEMKPAEGRLFFPGQYLPNRWQMRAARGRPKEVPPESYPLLVTFADITDPATVEEVDPANLAATFGAGVRLKSWTVEFTADPVTQGQVEQVLPWIPRYFDQMLDGRRIHTLEAENQLANSLGSGSFTTWREK